MAQRITVKPDNTAQWHGTDAGPLTVHHLTKTILVLKAASHKYWSGRFSPQATAPTRFYVFEIDSIVTGDGIDGTEYNVSHIVDFPLRKQER